MLDTKTPRFGSYIDNNVGDRVMTVGIVMTIPNKFRLCAVLMFPNCHNCVDHHNTITYVILVSKASIKLIELILVRSWRSKSRFSQIGRRNIFLGRPPY